MFRAVLTPDSMSHPILVFQDFHFLGLSYFGCQCNDSDDADIAQYFKVCRIYSSAKMCEFYGSLSGDW